MEQFSKKLGLLLFILLASLSFVWARGLEVLKTTYFDIIYPPASKETAALIAVHADAYAEEIATRLGKKLPHRYPVYLSSKSELLNGYYTLFPYQRIVIYDATIADGELANSYDAILNVFYHELTHAISLWYYAPLLSLSFDEGVAVLFESRKDQGRLNDPLILHHIMQQKIDKSTPTWREAAGHKDVYPGAFWAYIYGAKFLSYLEAIYGKDKYIKFFHNHFFVFPKGKAKRIFGKTLEELWSDFVSSISYPEEVKEPLVFAKKEMGEVVLSQSEQGFACYDSSKKSVYFYDKNEKKTKLFSSPSSISDLNFSLTGSKLLVSDIKDDFGIIKHRLSIFDLQKKKFLKKHLFSIRYASYVSSNSICAIKVDKQKSHLVLLDDNLENEEVLFTSGPGFAYSHIYSPVYAGENKVAFIAANGLYRDILILNIEDGKIEKLELEEKLPAIRYLRSSIIEGNIFLTFSWADKDMLYRMAMYNINEKKLLILDSNISGGAFQPIVFSKEENLKIVYFGEHSSYKKLYYISDATLKETPAQFIPFSQDDIEPISEAPNLEGLSFQKYNIFSWAWKVLPLPLIIPPNDLKKANLWAFGGYFYGKDPTEFLEFSLQPLFYTKPFFVDIESNVKLDFTSFNLTFSIKDKNLAFAGRNTSFYVSSDTTFSLDKINKRFLLGAKLGVIASLNFAENIEEQKTLYQSKYEKHLLASSFYAAYSQIEKHYRLNRRFFAIDERGFRTSFGLDYFFDINNKNNILLLQANASFYVPIVPLKIDIGTYYGHHAYYKPSLGSFLFVSPKSLVGGVGLLPNMEEYRDVPKKERIGNNNTGISLDLSLRVFSYEIQKGTNLFLIYFNRINFELGYRAILNTTFNNSKVENIYFQSIYGELYLDISGIAKIGLRYSHPIEPGIDFGKFSMLFKADLFF